MEPIADTSTPRRHAGVVLRQEGRRSVVAADRGATVIELDPIGRAIWELSDGVTTIEEMVEAICQVFAVQREVAARDITSLVAQLHDAGVVDVE